MRYFLALIMLAMGLAGVLVGGPWSWTGAATFLVVAILDVSFPADEQLRDGPFPFRDVVLFLPLPLIAGLWLAYAHTLAAGASSLLSITGTMLSVAFLSALGGLPPAHELMHRPGRFARFYASLYLTIFLLPMNDLGHVSGHHLRVATADDYDTPRRGQSVYTFAFKSLWRQSLDSFALEAASLRKRHLGWWSSQSRFLQSGLTVSAWLGLWFAVAGVSASVAYLATMLVFYLVLGGFNYTQHYGLLREPGEPIEPRHAWNQLKPLSRSLSFEISNHSGHHLVPTRVYVELAPYVEAPQMPSIILCFLCAFVPPLWERMIARPRLELWDRNLASRGERVLARQANERAGWPQWLELA